MRKLAATVPRSITALCCAALLAALAGCGQTDQEKAREVVQEYVDARSDKDFEAVCDLFSDSFKQELAASDCPAFVAEQTSGAGGSEQIEFVDVHVRDDRARADLDVTGEGGGPSRIGLILERQDGEWRITALQ